MHPLANALIVVDVQNDFCPGGSLAVAHGDEVASRINTFIHEHNDEYKLIVATKDWHPQAPRKYMDEAFQYGDSFPHFAANPDYVDTWPVHCVEGTRGSDFHANLRAIDPQSRLKVSDVFPDGAKLEDLTDWIEFDQIFYKGQESAAYSGFEGRTMGENVDIVGLNDYLKIYGIGHVDVVGLATDYCVKATANDAVNLGYDTSVLTSMCAGVDRQTTIGAIEEMLLNRIHVDGWWG